MTAVMPPRAALTILDDLADGLEQDDPLGYIPCSDCWYCEQVTQRDLEEGDYHRENCECRAGAECPMAPYSAFDDYDM